MSRIARIVVPGFPHHVTQRGNRGAAIFCDDDDRHAYLHFLNQYARQQGLAVWAYCLMSNHVHLIVVPAREDSLSNTLRDAHTVYAMRFNTRMQLNGHLWQGRFYSCPMDDDHLWAAVRYVERNPVRAGMVLRAADHPWSSARAHCWGRRDALLASGFPPTGVIDDWPAWLEDDGDPVVIARIRRHTNSGRPCGNEAFTTQLEAQLGRSLRPRRAGRRRKNADADTPLRNGGQPDSE